MENEQHLIQQQNADTNQIIELNHQNNIFNNSKKEDQPSQQDEQEETKNSLFQKKPYYSSRPKWFEDVDTALNKFSNQLEQTKLGLDKLDQGLKDFDKKKEKHDIQLREERKRNLAKKYSLQYNISSEYQENKQNSGLIRLNFYILFDIIEFAYEDTVKALFYLSRVCKKFNSLLTNLTIIKKVTQNFLGYGFVQVNEDKALYYENKKDNFIVKKFGYWRLVIEQFYKQLIQMKKSFYQYKNYNCPLEISLSSIRQDVSQALRFINDVFQLVYINKGKSFKLYQYTINLILFDTNIKGVFAISQLAQNESLIIRNDAFDALISLCGAEQAFREKLSIYINVNQFVQKQKIQNDKTIKMFINIDMNNVIAKQINQSIDFPSFLIGQLIFNYQFIKEQGTVERKNHNQFIQLQFGTYEGDIQQINSKLGKKLTAKGALLSGDANQYIEMQVEIEMSKSGKITGYGHTPFNQIVKINGCMNYNFKSSKHAVINQVVGVNDFGNGEVVIDVQNYGKSSHKCYINYCNRIQQNKLQDCEKYICIYGFNDMQREIFQLKIL